MIKVVFVDYMGTLVKENSKYSYQLIQECVEHSDAVSFEETAAFWFRKHDELLLQYNGDCFKNEYDIALEAFEHAREELGLQADLKKFCSILEKHWIYSPEYEDVITFFNECPFPIYIVTNMDTKYIEASMQNRKLYPQGIITSEKAGHYKPDKEIYDMALRISGCTADEAVHIGDSVYADVKGALAAGIMPILLNRGQNKEAAGVKTVSTMLEVTDWLKQL